MPLPCSQDIYGFYKGREPPSIEDYPVRLPSILSPTDLDPYEYQTIDATREIRILELLPPRRAEGNSDELLKCRLHKVILAEATEYVALSYTCGRIERHLPISVLRTNESGEQVEEALFGTPQLMMALRRLRYPTSSRMLWIDQLCIDQENNEEKGSQIQLMGDIYRTACEVVIWLGEDHTFFGETSSSLNEKIAYSQILDDTIKIMSTNDQSIERDVCVAQKLFDVYPNGHVNNPRRYRMFMITQLLERPWFTRAWVFQEASFAKQLKVLYGGLEVPFEDLKRLCDAVSQAEKIAGVYRHRSLAIDTAGFEMMQFIQHAREELCSNVTQSDMSHPKSSSFLTRLLQVLRRVRCYDQRDLIFVFLAFQNGEGITASAESYHRSTEEIWKHAAECIIKSSQSLDIFAGLSGDKPRDMILPSWVPYWSDCFPHSRPIATPATKFRAALDTRHVWSAHPDPLKLRVKGKIIDEVFGESDYYHGPSGAFGEFMPFKHHTGLFIHLDLMEQDARRYYFGDPAIRNALGIHAATKIQTLRRDIMRIVLADGALGLNQPLRSIVDDMLEIHNKSSTIWELRGSKSRDEMTLEEIEMVEGYETLEDLVLVAEHKQLFSTKNFLRGMAPEGIRVGDKIAIIHGSTVPCVLRAVDAAKNEYRVLSQCYLDGWMFGKPRPDVPRPHPHLKWWEEEMDDLVLV